MAREYGLQLREPFSYRPVKRNFVKSILLQPVVTDHVSALRTVPTMEGAGSNKKPAKAGFFYSAVSDIFSDGINIAAGKSKGTYGALADKL